MPENLTPDNNIAYTIAQHTNKLSDQLQKLIKCHLKLLDHLYKTSQPIDEFEQRIIELNYRQCIWCKERGALPSEYLKPITEFNLSGYDEERNGWICDSCLTECQNDETKENLNLGESL